MKTTTGDKKNGGPAMDRGVKSPNPYYDGRGLHTYDLFHMALGAERKRAERSGKSFLLMLLHIGNAIFAEGGEDTLDELARLLLSHTRETDIKGWYKPGSVIGVIFTETSGLDKYLLREKIMDYMADSLGLEIVSHIVITLHVFPEEKDLDRPDITNDMTLYTDITAKCSANRVSLFIKRAIDIMGSLAGIMLFLPFFILIPVGIKLTSAGPVFFRQKRVGQFGRNFTFLKFRSMYVNSSQDVHKEYIKKYISEQSCYGKKDDGNRVYKIQDDKRITPLGGVLRKTSLDEIPQFFNVLMGEMSLVGPRPPIPYEVENYDVWHRRRLLEVKPGITGLWQVTGRSSTTFDEMVRLDLQYSREWSIWLDLMIILKTPLALIHGKGAY